MAPVPHPVKRILEYLRNKRFPQALYVIQPTADSPISVGFKPGLTFRQKNVLLKVAVGQCRASADGTVLRIDQAELRRRESRKFTLEEIVEIFRPILGTGILTFSYNSEGENEYTVASIELRRGIGEHHISAVLPEVERSIKSIPGMGQWTQVSIKGEAIVVQFPGRNHDIDWLNWISERLSTASRMYFEVIHMPR
jgi:hypothetical protein